MKKFTKNKNKGFTIVELIVVMAIIAILILIAVPTFTRYIEDANETSEMGTSNTIYKSAVSAVVDDFASPDHAVIPATGLVDATDAATTAFVQAINDGVTGNNIIIEVYGYTPGGDAPTTDAGTNWEVYIPSTGGQADATQDIFVISPTDTVYQNGVQVTE